jgi:hypothetical protein
MCNVHCPHNKSWRFQTKSRSSATRGTTTTLADAGRVALPFFSFSVLSIRRVPHPLRRARFWFLRSEQRVGLRCTPYSQPPVSDLHLTSLAAPVIAIAAPLPQLWRRHQSSFHRIAMNIAQLFHVLSLGKDIEIRVTRLPKGWRRGVIPQPHLIGLVSLPASTTERDALLEHLHG